MGLKIAVCKEEWSRTSLDHGGDSRGGGEEAKSGGGAVVGDCG